MPFNLKFIPAVIKELANFVQVLNRNPLGATMLILVILTIGITAALWHLPTLVA